MEQVDDELVVSNIGDPSKEVYNCRDRPENFYMLGSFGLVSSISLGLALAQKRKVVCLDGDGSLLTNLGSLATIANTNPGNLILIALDNGTYGTTGNQKSYASGATDLEEVAKSCGFSNSMKVDGEEQLLFALREGLSGNELFFIHALIDADDEKTSNIPLDPVTIKDRFMESL